MQLDYFKELGETLFTLLVQQIIGLNQMAAIDIVLTFDFKNGILYKC